MRREKRYIWLSLGFEIGPKNFIEDEKWLWRSSKGVLASREIKIVSGGVLEEGRRRIRKVLGA